MNDTAVIAIFPFLFLGMWLMIGAALAVFSGWRELQENFPDTGEDALRKMRFRSGQLGRGSLWNPWGNVTYSGCLRIDICRSGLRVRIWRIFGPFCQPFLVPWDRITVEQSRFLLARRYRLGFDPELSRLTVSGWTFDVIEKSGLLPRSAQSGRP